MNAAPTGTLIHLDPATIATDKNIRTDLQITPEWVKGLKQHGVLTPISAYWDNTLQQYQVEAGHRRAVGAVHAELPTIPVYVIDPPAADTDRVVEQLVENVQRAALHDTEEASAYRQLSFAMPAMQIAKRTGSKLARIGDAIKVAGNPIAEKALADYQLTIDDALVFDEFSDDSNAIDVLEQTVNEKPGQLAHVAEQLRVDRQKAAERATFIAENVDTRATVITERPRYDDPDCRPLEETYKTAKRKRDENPDLADIPDANLCAIVSSTQRWEGGEWVYGLKAEYYVINPTGLGYFVQQYGGESAKTAEPEISAEERQAELTAKRQVRENNKLWAPATTVRLAWVKKLLERRVLPPDAPALAALWAAQMDGPQRAGRSSTIAHDLLGLKHPKDHGPYTADTTKLRTFLLTSPNQGMHVLVAVAVGSIEGCLDEKDGWRGDFRGMLPLYLKQLAAWGYTLSDIEQGIVDATTAKSEKSAA